jgi:predicted ATPase/DNA-binding SARP family transcriptional activator
VEWRVLGPLVVLGDDARDLTPRGPQQRRLLTALVAAAPELVTIDTLADLLWPHGAPSANALQAQVSKIRRALGGVSITGDGRGYALVPAPGDRVDATVFEELARAARRAVDGGDHHAAAERYGEALRLVRGTSLHDVADAEAFRPHVARLEALIAAARRGRAEALLAVGHVDDATAELEAHLAAAPLDEGGWASLMVAQARLGRQGDALRTYQRARRILTDELGIEPGPELREMERRVLDQDPRLVDGARSLDAEHSPAATQRAPVGRIARRVPARLTPLIGRDDVLASILADIDESRLVTLVGPGGAGKTSTAFEIAREWSAGAAVVAELAPIGDPDAVASEVAAALGLSAADAPLAGITATTFERLVDAIAGQRLLLVLDNCEHVVDAAAKLVHRLLEACDGLTVLATSREALSVPGERVVVLPPLAERAAVELFAQRARAAAPGASFDDDGDVIAEICQRLDGLPLAIELAAARVRSMAPAEVLDRLDDRFTLLSAGVRTLEPRQQTLRAVVDWSHDLLDEAERAVFRRLAAFSGGATLAAAEVVCADGEQVLAAHVAGTVERLIDKSLVVAEREHGAVRYTMLQTLMDYADERLREAGEVERVRDRHARYYAELIAPALHGLLGRDQRAWIERVSSERENVRLALDVALAQGDADLALALTAPLGWYFYMVAQTDVGAQALEDALSCPGVADPGRRALALAHYGWLAANGPEIGVALDATAEAIDLTACVDDAWLEAFVLATRVMACFFGGRIDEVRGHVAALDDAARRSGDGWAAALAALVRGEIAHHEGRAADAEAAFWDAAGGFERVGDEFSLAITLTEAAEMAEVYGDYDHAVDLLHRGIEASERVGFSGHPLGMRARLGNVEALRGNLDLAERLHLELLADIGDVSLPWLRSTSYAGLAMIARRRGRPEEAERWLATSWALARTRDVPVVRAMVLSGRGYTADQLGDGDAALQLQLEALQVSVGHGMPRAIANGLEGVAGAIALSSDAGDQQRAARLLGAADAIRRRTGGPMPPAERFDVDRAERRCRAALGDEAFAAAYAAGASTSVDDAVADALGVHVPAD